MDDHTPDTKPDQRRAAATVEEEPATPDAPTPCRERRQGLIRADELPPVPDWMRKPPGKVEAGLFDDSQS